MDAETIAERIVEAAGGNRRILLAWSGGKDSTLLFLTCMRYLRDRCDTAYVHIAGNTHYSNVLYVEWLRKRYGVEEKIVRIAGRRILDDPAPSRHPILYHVISLGRTGRGYLYELGKRGFPVPMLRIGRRGKRWCCEIFKTEPLETLAKTLGYKYVVNGMKASDSRYRRRILSNTWIINYKHYTAIMPLHDLADQQVWIMIKQLDSQAYSRLRKIYDAYGGAINCIICPLMSRRNMVKLYRTLDPKTLENIRNTLKQLENDKTYTRYKIKQMITTIDEALIQRSNTREA